MRSGRAEDDLAHLYHSLQTPSLFQARHHNSASFDLEDRTLPQPDVRSDAGCYNTPSTASQNRSESSSGRGESALDNRTSQGFRTDGIVRVDETGIMFKYCENCEGWIAHCWPPGQSAIKHTRGFGWAGMYRIPEGHKLKLTFISRPLLIYLVDSVVVRAAQLSWSPPRLLMKSGQPANSDGISVSPPPKQGHQAILLQIGLSCVSVADLIATARFFRVYGLTIWSSTSVFTTPSSPHSMTHGCQLGSGAPSR